MLLCDYHVIINISAFEINWLHKQILTTSSLFDLFSHINKNSFIIFKWNKTHPSNSINFWINTIIIVTSELEHFTLRNKQSLKQSQ